MKLFCNVWHHPESFHTFYLIQNIQEPWVESSISKEWWEECTGEPLLEMFFLLGRDKVILITSILYVTKKLN